MLVFYSKHNVSGWKSSPCKVDSTACVFFIGYNLQNSYNKTFYDEPMKKKT